jgi:hypothetical protein
MADQFLDWGTKRRKRQVPSVLMWCTVLVLAFVATVDPVRLGASVLLYSRPRPVPHLVAFWLGGLTTSAVLALGVLFGLRDVALGTNHPVQQLAFRHAIGGD